MKYLIVFVLSALTPQAVFATPLAAKQIEAELGEALGFKVYRYEVELGTDEALVIREISDSHGKVQEVESVQVGSNVRVKYEIVLVDSGAFHPSLKNSYMLRYSGAKSHIEGKWLTQAGNSSDGSVDLIFCSAGGNDPLLKMKWIGSVQKYSEVLKRWPGLPKPRPNSWSGSRRIVTKG